MLPNMAKELINSTTLLENSIWQIFSGGSLSFSGEIGKYNSDLMVSSTAQYHLMYLKQDGNCLS